MPPLARKILIIAAVEGLILAPLQQNSRASRSSPTALTKVPPGSIRVDYSTNRISARPEGQKTDAGESSRVEAHGIAGIYIMLPSQIISSSLLCAHGRRGNGGGG